MFRRALQRKKLLLFLLVAALAAGAGYSQLQGEHYRATARIQIQPGANGQGGAEHGLQREFTLLQSRFLAERVIAAEGLAEDPAFLSTFGLADAEPTELARIVHDSISIQPIAQSQLVEVSSTTPDPVYSAELANAWSEQFIADNYEKRFGNDAAQRQRLGQQLEEQRQELARAEAALAAFADQNDLVVIDEPAATGEGVGGDLANAQLSTLNQAVIDASLRRIAARGALDDQRSEPDMEAMIALRNRRSEAQRELAALGLPDGRETARSQALRAEIAALDGQIARADVDLDPALQADYEQALREEEELRALFEAQRASLQGGQGRATEYAILQHDVESNRDLYEALLQRVASLVPDDVGSNNATLVDRAAPPLETHGWSLPLILAVFIAAALAVWIALALMLEGLAARRL